MWACFSDDRQMQSDWASNTLEMFDRTLYALLSCASLIHHICCNSSSCSLSPLDLSFCRATICIWSFRLTSHGVDALVCCALILFHEIELFSHLFVRFANAECLVHIQILFFGQSYLRIFVLDSYYDPVPNHLVRERVIRIAKRTGSGRCSSPVPSS